MGLLCKVLPFVASIQMVLVVASLTCEDVDLLEGCFCVQSYEGRKEVNCHDLGLTQMPVLIPSGRTINFESVSLSGNHITEIADNSFWGVIVKRLYLPNNGLQRIGNEAFVYSSSTLVHLDLSHNQLSEVPAGIMYLSELETVVLTDNDIFVVDWAIFQSLGNNGASLYLDQNPIESYRHEHDSDFQLKKLAISLNSFEHKVYLMSDPFEAIPEFICRSLESLLFTRTTIFYFEVEGSRFPNIQYIGLERCLLTDGTFNGRAFKSVRDQLRGLSLADNLLTHFAPRVIADMVNLEHLDLSKNALTAMPDMRNLPSLKSVDFSGNRIEAIESGAMDQTVLPSLQSVDISNNDLTTLPPNAIPVSQLTSISIKKNPWLCFCENKWLIELIQRDAQEGEGPFSTAEMFRESDGARCFGGPLLVDFNVQDLECPDYGGWWESTGAL